MMNVLFILCMNNCCKLHNIRGLKVYGPKRQPLIYKYCSSYIAKNIRGIARLKKMLY